ncbi:hypothetical protein [Streptomyces sp. NPDC050560]
MSPNAHRCLDALRTDPCWPVRYLVSPETLTVILVHASPRHPEDTE